MRHTRQEVIKRTVREFEQLDRLVADLTDEQWKRLVPRPESKDPWTVKDALAHIAHFKADVIRSLQGKQRDPKTRGLTQTQENHGVFMRWHLRPPQEVLAWHRQVQQDVLAALRAAPDAWFTSKERRPEWPFDLDGHSSEHRVKDIERALAQQKA
jgi:uncharacterized damage-inducible protein DinB